jgi:hypothetical protein
VRIEVDMPFHPIMFAQSAVFTRHSSKALLNRFETDQAIRRVASSALTLHGSENDDDGNSPFSKDLGDEYIFSDELQVVTWNIAAPNNNPFEFWATHESKEYIHLMSSIQEFLDNPGDRDVEIQDVFTDKMYFELREELALHGVHPHSLHLVDDYWMASLRPLRIISGFLRDPSFGEKRLISMPDRITGAVRVEGGREICRLVLLDPFQALTFALRD